MHSVHADSYLLVCTESVSVRVQQRPAVPQGKGAVEGPSMTTRTVGQRPYYQTESRPMVVKQEEQSQTGDSSQGQPRIHIVHGNEAHLRNTSQN